jgi:hypothetical protein
LKGDAGLFPLNSNAHQRIVSSLVPVIAVPERNSGYKVQNRRHTGIARDQQIKFIQEE